MAEERQRRDLGEPRLLRRPEIELISELLRNAGRAESIDRLSHVTVQEIEDGKMGSLYFVSDTKPREERRMGRCIAQTLFSDVDGVNVLASLDLDQDATLYELDVWRVDFQPTIRLAQH